MQEQQIDQILENQDTLLLSKLIESKKSLSKIKLIQYLAEIFNQKKEINIEFLKLLLQTDIDKKSATKKGFLPSHLATLFGDAKVTKVFIDNGFDMNEKGELALISDTPLSIEHFTISLEPETKRTPKSEDKKYISPFGTAFENYNSENIKLLINNGADIHEPIYKLQDILKQHAWQETDALAKAIENNDTEVVELVLKNVFNIEKLNINVNIATPCKYGNFPLIKLLIDYGLNINKNYPNLGTLLEICANKDYSNGGPKKFFNIVKYLIENGADVNIGSPLMSSLRIQDGKMLASDIAKLLIKNGADVNYIDSQGKSILMEACADKIVISGNGSYDLIKLLIEYGVNINYQDKNGNSALMLINTSDEDEFEMMRTYEDGTGEIDYRADVVLPSEQIMQLLIDNGADINIRNNMGMTPLMKYSLENNHRLVKILLERGADINIKSEMTAFDLSTDNEIKSLINQSKNTNPQKLVKILANFTEDKPMKFTTHNWDFGELNKSIYKDFDGYMNAVKKQWNGIKDDLEALSPNLYKKVYDFLWETSPNIAIGWSSMDGLKEWCDDGKNHFDFKNFKEIISAFKKEIEIRKDDNMLENIFGDIEEDLDDKYEDVFVFEFKKLQGVTFYTDTEKFKNALNIIFSQMSEPSRHKYSNIIVECIGDETKEFIELKITQMDSVAQSSAEVMLKQIENGDFASIKENLKNLCDWSIESSFKDSNYRVNYLKSNNLKDIEELEYKPLGFTHILRFYNK